MLLFLAWFCSCFCRVDFSFANEWRDCSSIAAKKRKIVDADFDLLMPHLEQMRALHQNDVAGETQPLFVPQRLALPQEFNRSSATPPTRQEDSSLGHPSLVRPSSTHSVASQPPFLTTFQASHLAPATPSYSLDANWPSTQPNLQVHSPSGAPSTMPPSSQLSYGPHDPKPFQTPSGTRHVTSQSPTPYVRSPQPPTTYAGHAPPRTSPLDMQSSALFNGAPCRQEDRLSRNPNATEAFASPASPFRQGHERMQETNATGESLTTSLLSLLDFASDFDLDTPCPPGKKSRMLVRFSTLWRFNVSVCVGEWEWE